MILYHGSFIAVENPDLQTAFRTETVLSYLKLKGSDKL